MSNINQNLIEQSTSINNLLTALAKAQGELPVIDFDKTAEVKGVNKNGAYKYGYKYASMAGIVRTVRPILANNGLSFIQIPVQAGSGQMLLITRLAHESGEWLQGSLPLAVDSKDPQVLGSNITYAKRYALSAMLGVVTDDDDDGASANLYREDAAAAKQAAQEEKERQRTEAHINTAMGYLSMVERDLENATNTAEITLAWDKHQQNLLWLRANHVPSFDKLVLLKDNLKIGFKGK